MKRVLAVLAIMFCVVFAFACTDSKNDGDGNGQSTEQSGENNTDGDNNQSGSEENGGWFDIEI